MLSEMHHGCVRCSKFITQILGEISCLKCCTYPCQVKLRQTFEYFQAWALEGGLGGTKALWIFKITAKNVFFLVSREKKQISPLTAPPSVPLEKILPTPMLPENHIVYRVHETIRDGSDCSGSLCRFKGTIEATAGTRTVCIPRLLIKSLAFHLFFTLLNTCSFHNELATRKEASVAPCVLDLYFFLNVYYIFASSIVSRVTVCT